ncbi:MAG: PepSY domain-containing protein, partial [Beijerinckiaceae bacterium]
MLKKAILGTIAVLAIASTAPAQQPPVIPPAPAVSGATAVVPAPGANSFTETQARTRLESQGFSSVGALIRDADGIWRGSATREGR